LIATHGSATFTHAGAPLHDAGGKKATAAGDPMPAHDLPPPEAFAALRRPPVGVLVRRWRTARGLTQEALALEAGLSPRHLSFIETGRSAPGRAVLLRLCESLDLPMRARNQLLDAAGFAPAFAETAFEALPADGVRALLRRVLDQQKPYPGLVADSAWTIRMTNSPAMRMVNTFVGEAEARAVGADALNAMKQLFHPALLRPFVENWEEVARHVLVRLRQEAASGPLRAGAERLLTELMAFPGAPALRQADPPAPAAPAMTVRLRRGALRLNYVSMLSTFGTPQDITLEELRIKLFFPADAESAATFARLAEG
jgi:transcriptional regulator with XRE-family HTH domain